MPFWATRNVRRGFSKELTSTSTVDDRTIVIPPHSIRMYLTACHWLGARKGTVGLAYIDSAPWKRHSSSPSQSVDATQVSRLSNSRQDLISDTWKCDWDPGLCDQGCKPLSSSEAGRSDARPTTRPTLKAGIIVANTMITKIPFTRHDVPSVSKSAG
jgi:hypothetical protein